MIEQVGRYRVVSKLGQGAMGVVYLAEDPVLSRKVAIKTVELAPDDRRSHDFLRDRLVRDGRAAAGLSHPNIVSVYDVLEEGNFGYLVMEYVAGESLASYLARTPLPDTPFVLRVLREMASALDYTHARGIIHRDIKPGNVMLDANSGGAAKIMDFGIARISDTRTMTPAGMVMGTLEYMAPEQIKGEPVDGRADQFALAAVAYEMFTGATLYGEQTFATLAYKIVNEMPPPMRSHSPGLPQGVEEVVARALRKPPADRFQTCGGFVGALERAFSGEVPPTGAQTLAMLIPPAVVPPAPPPPAVAPTAPLMSAVPPAYGPPSTGPVTTGMAPPSPVQTVFPASQVPVSPYAPTAAAPAQKSNRNVILVSAGILAAAVAGAGLVYWRPWAPPPPQQVAEVPDVAPSEMPKGAGPGSGAGRRVPASSAATGTPPPAKPQAPQAPPPVPPVPGGKSTAPNTPPPQPVKPEATIPDPGVDTPPETTPSEPDPSEGGIAQPARAAFRKGEELIRNNQFPAAIREFTKAIDANPGFLRAYMARGNAYLHQNRPADAFADFSELLRRNPKNAMAIAQRGICHARLHDDDAALADFNRALEMRADIPSALNGRGLVEIHRKEYNKAIDDFTKAIQFSPKFGFAYLNRAQAEQAAGNLKAAQADRDKAMELGFPPKQ